MADYYTRTPDYENSRGPFDAEQLLTIKSTRSSFQSVNRFRSKVSKKEAHAANSTPKKEGLKMHNMLAAASCETDETNHIKKQNVNFEKAATLSLNGIGTAMLLSALALLTPHSQIISHAISVGQESPRS